MPNEFKTSVKRLTLASRKFWRKKKMLIFTLLFIILTSCYNEYYTEPVWIKQKISINSMQLEKNIFISNQELATIGDLKEVENSKILISGTYRAALINKNKEYEKNISLRQYWFKPFRIAKIKGNFGFYNIESLRNYEGEIIHLFNRSEFSFVLNNIKADDINNDGKTEFIISGHYEGTRVFDDNGTLLWKSKEGAYNSYIDDINNDSKLEIILIQPDSKVILNSSGDVVERLDLEIMEDYEYTRARGIKEYPKGGVYCLNGRIYLDAKNCFYQGDYLLEKANPEELSTEHLHFFDFPHKPIEVNFDNNTYLVLLGMRAWQGDMWEGWEEVVSDLIIFNEQKEEVYREIIRERCEAMLAVPIENNKKKLLVGCEGIVYEYSIN